MRRLPVFGKRIPPIWPKAILGVWMFLVVFLFLLLFGSPEFWLLMERLGISNVLEALSAWLAPYFTADYLS